MESKVRSSLAALLIVATTAFSVSACFPLIDEDDPVEIEDEDEDDE
jgi:hypothetical protein